MTINKSFIFEPFATFRSNLHDRFLEAFPQRTGSSSLYHAERKRKTKLKMSKASTNKNENKTLERVQSFVAVSRNKAETTWRTTSQSFSTIWRAATTQLLIVRSNSAKLIKEAPLPIPISDDYLRGAGDILAVTIIFSTVFYLVRAGIRRYPTADHIPRHLVRRGATLHGSVVAVRDGDGLRIRHTPFFYRLFNAYMAPQHRNISNTTISVRLAGVDAPECAHFSKIGQKYGPIARKWLKQFATGEKVVFKMHSIDQYKRVVATVYRKPRNPVLRLLGLGKKNVSLELTRAGYATLYKGAGAQYGSERLKRLYIRAEEVAKRNRIGMWADRNYISPADHKNAIRSGNLKKLNSNIKAKQPQEPYRNENEAIEKHAETVGRLTSIGFEVVGKVYKFLQRYR